MPRNSIRRKTQAQMCLLLGALLVTVYLYEYFTDHKTLHLRDVKNSVSQTKAPTKSNSTAYSWPRCQQNVSAANQSGFSSFTVNFQNFLYYRHCRHFPLLLDIPDKCGGPSKSADVFLLLVIKSAPVNYDRREVLRKTWAKERLHNGVWIRRVFIVGNTDPNPLLERERMNKLLQLEQREYNDILQWDFKDSFYNLTLKQILFLEWMEINCPHARFLLNGDDDVFANTDNMVKYLQSLKDNDGSKHLFIGSMMYYQPPVREVENRYFVSEEVFKPDYFPPYCSGGGYLLSGYTASVIYNMSKSVGFIPIDDAYMGMCLAKAELSPASHIGVHPHAWRIPSSKIDQYDPCYFKEELLVHGFRSANMFFMWQRLHDPDLKCDPSETKEEPFKL
ncbi:N-acetyllactosaminide beta-1,3-N-acetylglucosaminyltransferase 3-like [Sebastes fasciatus]|uniref:N-acetyllactosaminide beta-1,3-N-acetylglucosaminyltransferase 3-like n=1 Tax=Sebastes fasciatus TaxID=394691 RepID=UPI003D9E281A